jgi:hypothetical protein
VAPKLALSSCLFSSQSTCESEGIGGMFCFVGMLEGMFRFVGMLEEIDGLFGFVRIKARNHF